jgi:hypothetical protein
MPHDIAWNIGEIKATLSSSEMLQASGRAAANECNTLLRWLYSTPLGLPVVPDV